MWIAPNEIQQTLEINVNTESIISEVLRPLFIKQINSCNEKKSNDIF